MLEQGWLGGGGVAVLMDHTKPFSMGGIETVRGNSQVLVKEWVKPGRWGRWDG